MYSHPGSLQGQTVIVTGASRGIGLGIATALAERGAQLFVTDIDAVALQSAVRRLSEIGPAIGALAADLIQPDSPGAVVEAAVDRFGSVHGLVNNAIWIMPARPIDEHTDEHFDRTFDSGPKATFRLMQAVHPHLKAAGGGSIVNLGSSAGTAGQPGMATYGGAKEAIRGISRTAALEWGADNIRVNVICPFANSESFVAWRDADPQTFQKALEMVPLGRLGDVKSDVGAAAAWLLGADSSYLTAQTLWIAGGWGLTR